jgi:hypothetical protein
MAQSEEWQETKYKEVFEQEITGLTRRLRSDPCCKIEDLQAILRNLYIMEGSSLGGHGCLQDTIFAATIAAYEHFISKLEAEAK